MIQNEGSQQSDQKLKQAKIEQQNRGLQGFIETMSLLFTEGNVKSFRERVQNHQYTQNQRFPINNRGQGRGLEQNNGRSSGRGRGRGFQQNQGRGSEYNIARGRGRGRGRGDFHEMRGKQERRGGERYAQQQRSEIDKSSRGEYRDREQRKLKQQQNIQLGKSQWEQKLLEQEQQNVKQSLKCYLDEDDEEDDNDNIEQQDDMTQVENQQQFQLDDLNVETYFQQRRQLIELDEEKEKQMNLKNQNRNGVKFLNKIPMQAALKQNSIGKLVSLFESYLPGCLKQAIDNVDINRYKSLFDDLMQSYFILVESKNSRFVQFIKEIFESQQFKQQFKLNLRYKDSQFINKLIESFFTLMKLTETLDFLPISDVKIAIKLQYNLQSKAQLNKLELIENHITEMAIKQQIKMNEQQTENEKMKLKLKMEGIKIDYKYSPCEPVVEDFKSKTTFGQIIEVQQKGYISLDLYLNNNFYILREDFLREYRNSVQFLMNQQQMNHSQDRNVNIYNGLLLDGLEINNSGIYLKIMMKTIESKKIDWDKSSRLMCGSLLLIADRNFSKIVFVQVCKKIKSIGNYITLLVTVVQGQDTLYKLNNLKKISEKQTSIIVENKIFFDPYYHYLKCLQQKSNQNFPFIEQIILGSTTDPMPKYFNENAKTLGLIYKIDLNFSLAEKIQGQSIPINIFEEWPQDIFGTLDNSQVRAVKHMLTHGIALIQGPPGTGKTFCGALALRILMKNRTPKKPIIIVCYTNHALDQFLKHIMTFVPKSQIARIGGRCKDPELQSCVLGRSYERRYSNFDWKEFKNLQRYLSSRIHFHFQTDQNIKIRRDEDDDGGQIDQQNVLDSDEDNDRNIYAENDFNFDYFEHRKYLLIKKQQRDEDDERNGYFRQSCSESFEDFQDFDGKCFWGGGSDRHISEYSGLFSSLEWYQRELKHERINVDINQLRSKQIIGLTITGCAKYASKLQSLDYDTMIIEEAAEVLECHTAAILTSKVKHLILIGDHQQLRPKLESYYLEKKYKTEASLFERLVMNEYPYVTLSTQRRMKSKFADFIRLIYGNNYIDHPDIEKQNELRIRGFSQDLIFFDHNELEDKQYQQSSKSNQFEAKMIVKQVDCLIKNQHSQQSITVLSMYVKQLLNIKQQLSQMGYQQVNVQSVDNYQGEENDIIILSLVRSNQEQRLGFIGIDNRICVALSRARIGLYVFGNFQFIKESIQKQLEIANTKYTDLWIKIINLALEKGALQSHFSLKCPSHSNVTEIKSLTDWDKVPGGGCTRECNTRFECGHLCTMICHYISHSKKNCISKVCEVILPCNHQCQKQCNVVPCPPCHIIIEKTMNICGHKQQIPCTVSVLKWSCKAKCEKMLECGHECQAICSQVCSTVKCMFMIQRQLVCNHSININCCDQSTTRGIYCTNHCQFKLPCAHLCNGVCGTCTCIGHNRCTNIECDTKTLLMGLDFSADLYLEELLETLKNISQPNKFVTDYIKRLSQPNTKQKKKTPPIQISYQEVQILKFQLRMYINGINLMNTSYCYQIYNLQSSIIVEKCLFNSQFFETCSDEQLKIIQFKSKVLLSLWMNSDEKDAILLQGYTPIQLHQV